MKTHDFQEIATEFLARVSKMVWCNAATVDGQGRPRSRVVHPVWEGSTGWLTTDRGSFKNKHLAKNPFISLAYVGDVAKPAYADCHAQWEDDPAEQQRVWSFCASLEPPYGFDPGLIYRPLDGSESTLLPFGLIKLTPYRILMTQFPDPMTLWTPKDEAAWFAATGVSVS